MAEAIYRHGVANIAYVDMANEHTHTHTHTSYV